MCFYDMKARHKVSLQAIDNIDLNQMSHRYVSGVLQNDSNDTSTSAHLILGAKT